MLPNTQLEVAQTQQGRAKFVHSSSVDLNITPLGSLAKSVPWLYRCNHTTALHVTLGKT